MKDNRNIKDFINNVILVFIPVIYITCLFITSVPFVHFLAYTFSVPLIYLIFLTNKDIVDKKHFLFSFIFYFIPLCGQMFLMGVDALTISSPQNYGGLGIVISLIFLTIYNIYYYLPAIIVYKILKKIFKFD